MVEHCISDDESGDNEMISGRYGLTNLPRVQS